MHYIHIYVVLVWHYMELKYFVVLKYYVENTSKIQMSYIFKLMGLYLPVDEDELSYYVDLYI